MVWLKTLWFWSKQVQLEMSQGLVLNIWFSCHKRTRDGPKVSLKVSAGVTYKSGRFPCALT